MNIIDTSSNTNLKNHQNDSITNIPLFHIKGIDYMLSSKNYTDIIFQSISSVEFFKEKEILKNKNIYSMGPSTKNYLAQKGINSICPEIPGSKELNKLLLENRTKGKYLIIKGEDGLNDVFNHLNKNGENVEELICYTRIKLDKYDHIKKNFTEADAIIFSSTFAVEIFFEEIHSSNIKAKLFGISNRIIKFISEFGYEAKFINYFSGDIEESVKIST